MTIIMMNSVRFGSEVSYIEGYGTTKKVDKDFAAAVQPYSDDIFIIKEKLPGNKIKLSAGINHTVRNQLTTPPGDSFQLLEYNPKPFTKGQLATQQATLLEHIQKFHATLVKSGLAEEITS